MGINIITTQAPRSGYGIAVVQSFTIANGADGSAVDEIDLGRNYLYLMVTIEDASNIAASTNLSAQVGYGDDDDLVALYEINDPSTAWSKGSLPETGTLGFVLTHAVGVQRIRFVLSNNASGGSVVIKVRGLGGGIRFES